MLVLGVTGCMSEVSSQEAILTYLEEKYDEKFEVEAFKEGSDTFKQMYGADKVIVHPEGKLEHVFLAGEDRDHEGEYYDNYVLSIWSDELTRHYEKEIKSIFIDSDYEYRFLIYIEDDKYDSSMIGMSAMDYFKNINKDVGLVLKMAVKTNSNTNLNKYNKRVFDLFQLVKAVDVESTTLSIGFVGGTADVSDYIRTSSINNTPWSNMKGKVFGTVVIDNTLDISTPKDINQYIEMDGE